MTRIEELRELLRQLKDQAQNEGRKLLAYRIGLALKEAEAEIERRRLDDRPPSH